MGVYSEDSLEANVVMFRLVFVVAVAAAAPFLEDTTEVALAKAEFQAAFDAAVAGDHAALAPVNADVQAEQIPDQFLDDPRMLLLLRPSSSLPSRPRLPAVWLICRPQLQFMRSPWPPPSPRLSTPETSSLTILITTSSPLLPMWLAMLAMLATLATLTRATATMACPSSSSK